MLSVQKKLFTYAYIRLEDNNGSSARYSCLVYNETEIEDACIRYREYLLRKEKYKRALSEEEKEEEGRIRIKSSISARFNLASKLTERQGQRTTYMLLI